MNNVSIVGRMTRDLDLRYTNDGKAVGNTSIAVNRTFKNAQGDYEADFINIVVWGKTAENLANHMKKGDRIGLTGRIQTRSYEGKDGKRVYVTEVVADNVQFLEPKKQGNQQPNNGGYNAPTTNTQQQNQPSYTQQAPPQQESGHLEPLDIDDSDLPF